MSESETPAYPVYLSPDGETEQPAATPAREVQLKHAGWTLIRRPRETSAPKKTTRRRS